MEYSGSQADSVFAGLESWNRKSVRLPQLAALLLPICSRFDYGRSAVYDIGCFWSYWSRRRVLYYAIDCKWIYCLVNSFLSRLELAIKRTPNIRLISRNAITNGTSTFSYLCEPILRRGKLPAAIIDPIKTAICPKPVFDAFFKELPISHVNKLQQMWRFSTAIKWPILGLRRSASSYKLLLWLVNIKCYLKW